MANDKYYLAVDQGETASPKPIDPYTSLSAIKNADGSSFETKYATDIATLLTKINAVPTFSFNESTKVLTISNVQENIGEPPVAEES